MPTWRWLSPRGSAWCPHQEIQQRPEMAALLFLNCWMTENMPGQTSKHTRAPPLPACCWLLEGVKYTATLLWWQFHNTMHLPNWLFQFFFATFLFNMSSFCIGIIWQVYNGPIGEMCHFPPIVPKYSSKKKKSHEKCIFRYHWVTCWEQATFWHRDISIKMWKWSDSLE